MEKATGGNEEVTGENPALGGDMLIQVQFDAETTCMHGILAYCCAICHRTNWFECPVRPDPDDESSQPRTVGDVVRKYLESKKISSVKVVRRYVRRKQRQARAAARRQVKPPKAAPKGQTYRKWSVIAGLAVVSGILLYEGGKLVLKLWVNKVGKDEEQKP